MPNNNKNKIKKVTLHDVAKEAGGLTAATVSNVLNDTGSVSEEVKQRVRSAAKKLNYRTNQSAKAMRTGQTKTLGLILPDLTNPFFPQLAQSVEQCARESGYSVLLIDSQGKADAEQEGIKQLFQQGVDGIVWCPITPEDLLEKYAPNIPAVVVDRPIQNYDSVSSDYVAGERLIAEYAIDQGHQKIGLAAGPQELDTAKKRMQSFLDSVQGRAEVVWVEQNEYSMSLNENLKDKALQANASLIVAGNDLIAIGLVDFLIESGLRVPEDVSVIGFDDIPWCSIVRPKLTSIKQPISQMGREAVNTLLRRIAEPDMPKLSVLLDVSLSVRDTVARLEKQATEKS